MAFVEATVVIPSKGLLSGIPDGAVTLREMSTAEYKLLNSNMPRSAKILSILHKCIVKPVNCDTRDLLVSDLMYLFLELRALSVGKDYPVKITCPNCQANFQQVIQVPDSLDIKMVEDSIEEPYYITLPRSGDVVGLRHLRGKDMVEVEQVAKRKAAHSGDSSDDSLFERMARSIVSINGEERKGAAVQVYVDALASLDLAEVGEAMGGKDFGVDMSIPVHCFSCGYMDERVIPLTAEFFRPYKPGGRG